MKKFKGLMILLLVSLSLFGCSDKTEAPQSGESDTNKQVSDTANTYEQISGAEAYELMGTEKDYIIIDARTQEEYDEGHIENAIMIPEYEIADRAEKELPDKSQLILVYCRSGRRSKIAAQALADLGYTNVKEFGGIIDWEYEVVS